MDTFEIVGRNITYLRRKLGLSQEEVAYRAHIDRSYLSQVEHGKRNISLVVLVEIASALGVDAPSLMKESVCCQQHGPVSGSSCHS